MHARHREFATWCEEVGLTDLQDIEPVHVAAYVETLSTPRCALRQAYTWPPCVCSSTGLWSARLLQPIPASSVRGPKHSVKKGKTPVLTADEARALIDSIDISTPMGLRDRALIALMVYTFARVGAALKMKVEDVYVQGRRTWVRLHEKGGKQHEMPCHHNLDEYLHAYIDGAALIERCQGLPSSALQPATPDSSPSGR
jgi:integrase